VPSRDPDNRTMVAAILAQRRTVRAAVLKTGRFLQHAISSLADGLNCPKLRAQAASRSALVSSLRRVRSSPLCFVGLMTPGKNNLTINQFRATIPHVSFGELGWSQPSTACFASWRQPSSSLFFHSHGIWPTHESPQLQFCHAATAKPRHTTGVCPRGSRKRRCLRSLCARIATVFLRHFLHFFALFCTFLRLSKIYLPCFQANPSSFCKNTGGAWLPSVELLEACRAAAFS
jgi:hypothetical protein